MGKIRIDGIEVDLEGCDHCGLVPTKLDARKAIEAVRKTHGGRPCPACDLAVAIKSIEIKHTNRTGKRGETLWRPMSVVLKGAIDMELHGYKRTWIHVACVERLFGKRIERGNSWTPWYEGSLFTVTGS